MPFKSDKQRRFLYAFHPDVAKKFAAHEDLIPGGKGDDRDPSDFDPKEIEMGTKHEMEHTDDRAKAREIAIDHLSEDPHYYSDLEAAGRLFSSELDEFSTWVRSWAPDEKPNPKPNQASCSDDGHMSIYEFFGLEGTRSGRGKI